MQVVYNVFDQSAEGVLFPACRFLGVAVIARVPFDECHVEANLDVSDRAPLDSAVVARLRAHRWDRLPDDPRNPFLSDSGGTP